MGVPPLRVIWGFVETCCVSASARQLQGMLLSKVSTLKEHGIRPLAAEADGSAAQGAAPAAPEPHSVNLRDLGVVAPQVRTGIVFRSSQVVSPSHIKTLSITTVLDLRQAPLACQTHVRNVRQSVGRGLSAAALAIKHKVFRRSADVDMDPWDLLYDEEGLEMPPPCRRCTEACSQHYGCGAEVYHVDLLPKPVPYIIFSELPFSLQRKVIVMKLRGKGVEAAVAAAVADPTIMGYLKLYKIILDRAKQRVAAAVRVLTRAGPGAAVLVHCIHGKDRTGLVVMLVYLLAGVPREVIVADYAHSESLLREGREKRQLLGLPVGFDTDAVIAAAAAVMEATIDYLLEKYGSVEQYLCAAGFCDEDVQALRRRLQATGLPAAAATQAAPANGLPATAEEV